MEPASICQPTTDLQFSMVNLLTYPEDQQFLRTAHDIYKQYNKLAQAKILSIPLNNIDLIQHDFISTPGKSREKQMAYLVARPQVWVELPADDGEDAEIAECVNKTRVPE